MKLSQYDVGIIITFQNFVQVDLIPSMWPILQYPHLHILTIFDGNPIIIPTQG
jgi:hypothetical protein